MLFSILYANVFAWRNSFLLTIYFEKMVQLKQNNQNMFVGISVSISHYKPISHELKVGPVRGEESQDTRTRAR